MSLKSTNTKSKKKKLKYENQRREKGMNDLQKYQPTKRTNTKKMKEKEKSSTNPFFCFSLCLWDERLSVVLLKIFLGSLFCHISPNSKLFIDFIAKISS